MKRLLLVLVLLILSGAALWIGYPRLRAGLQPDLASGTSQLQLMGIIEAPSVSLSTEATGRVVQLAAAEGDRISAGQVLLALDDRLVRAQIAQADAVVAEARAQLAMLQAGARPEEVARAEAVVRQAQVAVEAAAQAWEDARRIREQPQELDLAISEAQTAAAKAEHGAAATLLLAQAADLERDLWGRVTSLLAEGLDVPVPGVGVVHVDQPAERAQANSRWNLASQQAWQAWQAAYAAQETAKAASTAVRDLNRQRANPIELDTQVNQAEAAYRQAEAAVEQAQAALKILQDGVQPEQIEVARSALAQAQAARRSLDVAAGNLVLESPVEGLVSAVLIHEGEVALAGLPVVEIVDPDRLTLRVYVPEPQVGQVDLRQEVSITVQSLPRQVFRGTVTRVADQAEYTPKTVQTSQERVHTVFAVEISVTGAAALNPGMPAQATFQSPGWLQQP